MRSSPFLWLAILVVTVVFLTRVEAGKKGRNFKRNLKRNSRKQCVYRRRAELGQCDPKTGNVKIFYDLDESKSRSSLCQHVKIKIRRCPGCKYPKRGIPFQECVDGFMSKVVPLAPGSNPSCPPERIITRKCQQGGRLRRKNRKGKKQRLKIKNRKKCVYKNREWSACNEETNLRQRERVLLSGDPHHCHPKKTVTKKCRKACRYLRGEWSECDNVTNTKNRTLEPKAGSLASCESQVQTRPCFYGAAGRTGRPTKCRYRNGQWSACDARTNTRTQEMTLRNGDPNLCQRSVKLTRKCKTTCKFKRGKWSKCNRMTRLMTRVDTLLRGDPKQCDKQREMTRKCRKAKCKYEVSGWSECDPETNRRTRVKTLLVEKSDTTGKCRQEISTSKSCLKKDGKVRCFFGKWGEFGACTNGVMTKQRPLLQGGMECERRAVTTRACDN